MTLPLRPAVLVRAHDEIQRRLLLEKVDFLGYEPVVAADDDDALAIAQVRELAAILCVHLRGATDCRELVKKRVFSAFRAALPGRLAKIHAALVVRARPELQRRAGRRDRRRRMRGAH